MAAIKQHSNRELFDFFQSKLSTLNSDSALKYRRTVSELDLFVTGHRLQLSALSLLMMADFSVELLRKGLAKNTVVYHLNILNGLVKSAAKRGLLEATDAPRVMARLLSESAAPAVVKSSASAINPAAPAVAKSASPLPPLMTEEGFAECLNMLRRGLKGDGSDKYLDMLLFSLLNGVMSLRNVTMLRKGDVSRFNEVSRGIAERNVSVKRDFVFDLRQSYSTPKKVYEAVNEELKKRFGQFVDNTFGTGTGFGVTSASGTRSGVTSAPGTRSDVRSAKAARDFDADTLARSIWVACAVKSGATVSEALACIGGSAEYALPEFFMAAVSEVSGKAAVMKEAYSKAAVVKEAVGKDGDSMQKDIKGENGRNKNLVKDLREGDLAVAEENKVLWDRTVNAVLTHDMPRWYAMHLRKGVDYDELRKDINEYVRPVPELFYPSETIKKRVGNKTVIDEKPYISNTVFFKSYPEKVLPMFSRIGDKAWCYRVTRNAGSPYAVISSRDMKRFQAVIGVFTPDVEVHSLGELTPKPGESVVVIKAGYNNRRGEVEEVINTASGSVLFRVKLATDQGYEWRLDLDERQIERILQ